MFASNKETNLHYYIIRKPERPKFLHRRAEIVQKTRADSKFFEKQELPASLCGIIKSFELVQDPIQRYKQLLYYAQKLAIFPQDQKVDKNKVPGCSSQVWIHSECRGGKFYFFADSDSQLTKGLAGLLVEGLSGASLEEILSIQPEFIEALGLSQTLTPSRTNGFLNMLNLVKQRASEQRYQISERKK